MRAACRYVVVAASEVVRHRIGRVNLTQILNPGAVWRIVGLCCVVAVGGCVGPMPRPDTAGGVASASGVDAGAVVFRSNAETDDAGEVPGELSLASAVRLAVEHDPRIHAAAARVRVALAEAGQA